jgi:hypothetical protein
MTAVTGCPGYQYTLGVAIMRIHPSALSTPGLLAIKTFSDTLLPPLLLFVNF